MELDDFKQIHQSIPSETKELAKDFGQEVDFSKVKSASVIQKIQRNLLIELVGSALALLLFAYIMFTTDDFFIKRYLAVVVSVVSVFYIDFYFRYRTIQKANPDANENLLVYLQGTVVVIEKFCKNYIRFNVGFTLLAVVTSFLLSAYQNAGPEKLLLWLRMPLVWVILISASAILMGLGYLFSKWWVGLLYGKHLQRLKENIRELNASS